MLNDEQTGFPLTAEEIPGAETLPQLPAPMEEARYIPRRYDESKGGFFDMLFRQLVVTMTALTVLFGCNLIPATREYVQKVKEVVSSEDYTDDVLAVFGED